MTDNPAVYQGALGDDRPNDVAISADGTKIYAAGNDGNLSVYSAATGELINTWAVGTQLGGMDISPDGSFVIVTELDPGTPEVGPDGYVVWTFTVHKVDLATGAVTDFSFQTSNGEYVFYDAAVLADGTVLLSQGYQGSGAVSSKILDPASGAFTELNWGGQNTAFSVSEDGSYVLALPANISDAPLLIYQTGIGVVAQHGGYDDGVMGFNRSVQAMSAAGGLAAQSVYGNGLHVYDLELHHLIDLTDAHPEWSYSVSGLAFDATGQYLFVLDSQTDTIVQLSTSDWSTVAEYAIGVDASAISDWDGDFGNGLIVAPDMSYFTVVTDNGLVVVDPTAPPPPTEDADTLIGTPVDDVIDGLGGNDIIRGLAGDDTLSGGVGSDTLVGGAGGDTINGGNDSDALYSGDISPGYIPVYGVFPTLDHGTEVDTLIGGAGDDVIFAGYGDNVDGGDQDWQGDSLYISFQGAMSGVTADFSLGTTDVGGGTITGIENIIYVEGSDYDDYINTQSPGAYPYAGVGELLGFGGNDTLIAGSNISLVDGGDGDDTIYTSPYIISVANGGDGNDALYVYGEAHGGSGNDTIVVGESYYAFEVTGDVGDDSITGNLQDDHLAGNDGNDSVVGGGGNDVLTGNSGSDGIDGGDGDDFLTGGAGADVLAGGGGNDRFLYDVGDGDDQITDIAAGDVVEVHGYVAVQSMTQVGGDVVVVFDDGNQITFSNSDTATVEDALYLVDAPPPQGTEGDDTLTGQSGNDIIDGLGGDDTIVGRGGHDILSGGAGSDQIEGGDGSDTLYSADASPPYDFPYYEYTYNPPLLDTGSEVDTVNGGAGDDTIFAGYGDNIDGGDGFDQLLISFQGATSGVTFDASLGTQVIGGGTITGIESVSWVEGSSYDDTVNLNAGYGYSSNVAFGMGGNDTLIGGYYTMQLDGGDGNDVLDGTASLYYLRGAYGGAGDDIITTTMSPGTVADGGDGNDTIYSASETHGGNGNDTIILSFSYYGINATGDAGDDVIQGSEGYETLSGGTGDDLLTGGGADDRFIFRPGDGQDVITDFAAGDVIQVEGYESFQSITQVGSDVVLIFSDGDQITFQNSDVATVEAGVQLPPVTDDFIFGGWDDENLYGFGGNDTIAGGGGADIIDGGSGNDDLFSADPDIYWGQPDAGTEHDVLIGGNGDDRLTIGYGDDADGGEGTDTLRLSFGGASQGVNFYTGEFVPGQPLSIAGGTIQNMEVLEYLAGSNFADQLTVAAQDAAIAVDGRDGDDFIAVEGGTGATIYGGAGYDRVDVYGGNVTIFGGDDGDSVFVQGGTVQAYGGWGDDYFVSGAGADTFFGDDGKDMVSYLFSGSGVTVDLSAGVTPDGDQLYSIESIAGSNYADRLTGDWQSNYLYGGKGNDTLEGLDGDDMLDGGAGNDTLRGGFGDDMYVIDNAKDAVIEAEYGGTDRVFTYINYTLDKNIENGQAIGSDAIKLVGNALDNSLDGNEASNILIGGGGNDILDGREGADSMNGGAGNDTYIVDNAGDKVGEAANDGIDEVVTLVNYTLASKVHVETMTAVWGAIDLTGNEYAQTLQGNDFDNVLSGGGGNDTLNGWSGNDRLKGGTGNDYLIGGWGADSFIFEAKPGNDIIEDFQSGIDKIDLHAFGITMNQVNAVVGADATILYVDSNHDGSADFTITLSGVSAPDTGDYIF